ncbi:sugar phosphate nucleotidyltransferase [Gloeocapsopsis sp. IPPAS B-1203]|uniref:sugar phosphate nucleotidyltransferase n=1 Tax=Gloeocapsopsis sp. IPPAS B-1203 TaxID=2049454 RepID=UPI000C18D60E|nr:sugar phosphate nucleotidyltransferase [Gloeocapsopsis sp. IPPAS B-1203]PIG93775.1 glucose-1-phosphate cytidylyltransferase [Gloeocapsopsis sp. IPPAS B-1203]
MKAVILAGGLGTRISEETSLKPKPMVEIGSRPILWHIMKIYSTYNINDFIICCGYKGYVIKEYFANYFLHMSDITLDVRFNQMNIHCGYAEPWRSTLVDTGELTMTGGRLLRVREHIGNQTFCFTYGDGVSSVNIEELISFQEKPGGDGAWINGGFFVLEPEVIDYIADDFTVWEKEPLEKLAYMQQLSAFKHTGFWQPMDTLRDKNYLENLWKNGQAPWKVW